MSSIVAPATIIFGPFGCLRETRVALAELPSITCLHNDVVTSILRIDRRASSPGRNRELWGFIPLSSLHLRDPLRIPAHMPHVARITAKATEVTTSRRSGRLRTVVNYAGQAAVKGPEEPMDPGSESPLTDLESGGDTEPPPPKKRRRKARVAEPVVYDIPPVETKTSTFKGKCRVKICARTNLHLTPRSFGIRTFHKVDITFIPH